ncbi:hypothetical protein BJX70DRAFT_367065 [Aspergillus crustosus]
MDFKSPPGLGHAVSHTLRSDQSPLSKSQLIGLIVGLTVSVSILGFGILLYILSYFPRAQKRFCDVCCTFVCPCVKKRLDEFDYMEMHITREDSRGSVSSDRLSRG